MLEKFGKEGQNVLLFSAPESASQCKKFVTSPARGDDVVSPDDITIKVLDINIRLWAVFFPLPKTPSFMPYWMNAGVGISSRLAEESLKHLDLLHEVTGDESEPKVNTSPSHGVVRDRIAELLERAPSGSPRAYVLIPTVYRNVILPRAFDTHMRTSRIFLVFLAMATCRNLS